MLLVSLHSTIRRTLIYGSCLTVRRSQFAIECAVVGPICTFDLKYGVWVCNCPAGRACSRVIGATAGQAGLPAPPWPLIRTTKATILREEQPNNVDAR